MNNNNSKWRMAQMEEVLRKQGMCTFGSYCANHIHIEGEVIKNGK